MDDQSRKEALDVAFLKVCGGNILDKVVIQADLMLGRALHSVILGRVSNNIEIICSRIKQIDNSLESISVHIIETFQSEAAAVRTRTGIKSVGITLGMILQIYDTCYRCLSHPEIEPQVGTPTKTSTGLKSEAIAFCNITEHYNKPLEAAIAKNISDIPLQVRPTDKMRFWYSCLLADLCIEILLFHELSHVLNRHVDYFTRGIGATGLAEIGGMRDMPQIDLEEVSPTHFRQAIEADADSTGAALWLEYLFFRMENQHQLDHFAVYLDANAPGAFRAFGFATAICFNIANALRGGVENNPLYPQPITRSQIVNRHFYGNWVERALRSEEERTQETEEEEEWYELVGNMGDGFKAGYDAWHKLEWPYPLISENTEEEKKRLSHHIARCREIINQKLES